MRFKFLLLAISILFSVRSLANQDPEFSGWSAIFHSQKLNPKLGLHLDVQARSSDEFDYLKNVLVRPGITFFFNNQINSTLGYGFINSKIKSDVQDINLTEHRVWEQLIYIQKIKSQSFTHRFRLEQRFIEQVQSDLFSQRLRYFLRTLMPLSKHEGAFQKGIFVGLQNELFLNLQNKDKMNNHFFDQNRAYGAFGYRFAPAFDLELGYMNQRIKQRNGGLTNHIIQIAAYTRF